MDPIKKALIPAAGLGTRMKPISNYLPKPMLPLGKKPVLQHIIEELKGAGVEEITIIKRSEYGVIEEYFSGQKGIHFIDDDSRSGPGGALLKAEQFVAEDEFVTVFADAPVLGNDRSAHLGKLMAAKQNKKAAAVLSIYQIPKSEVTSRGVVAFKDPEISENGMVMLSDIIEKPSKDKYPSRWASTCRYVLDANIFDALRSISTGVDNELQLTQAIRHLIHKGQSVVGIPLPNHLRRHDTGNFEGYFKAFKDFT